MTKRTKRILFYSAVAVFLVLSYVVILYAQGYKYSFSENRFFKTGAVYLKVNTDADVYLNDKLLGNTSFFGNSYRIEGLLPRKYTIKIQKDNYSSWQKLVTVDEGFVSEFSKILVLPEDEEGIQELDEEIALLFPTETPLKRGHSPKTALFSIPTSASEPFIIKKGVLFTVSKEVLGEDSHAKPETSAVKIADNVRGFVLSKDKNKLVWWTANEVWVMWLNDAHYQPYHKKGDKELITRFSTQIKKVVWFRDEDHLIMDSSGYKILEIDTRGGINIIEV